MTVREHLKGRNLPDLFTFADGTPVTPETAAARQKELLEILQKEVYGTLPPAPAFVSGEVVSEGKKTDFAGKAERKQLRITFGSGEKTFSFPVTLVLPRKAERPPFAVIINFRPAVPDDYIPAEELVDRGIGFAAFCYEDVSADTDDFSAGFAGVLTGGSPRTDTSPGKIAMWAYCASRVLDYVLENVEIDTEKVAVCGHSRLGKTALFAGACDPRFTFVYSNDSGCGGAALSHGKTGEHIADITSRYGYWFCPKYAFYAGRENALPFDQHFLLAAIAPRKIYVASAAEDAWADPRSEYLACVAAGAFFSLFEKPGFTAPDCFPAPGDAFHEGSIGYHMRGGMHYWSREDWKLFLDFFLQ